MMSIFTDCPDREKLGWLADMEGIFDSIARNYDIAAYERTVVRNMADGQTGLGLVPDFVPEYVVYDDGFRDDPNWGDAMILTPWSMYETYGDVRTLETYYPNMQRYLDYLTSKSNGNLLNYGLDDWISPDTTLPTAVMASYGYYQSALTLGRIATVLGRTADAERYAAMARDIGDAFNSAFLDTGKHSYGHQAADAVALDMGIVPADQRQGVVDDLIADIRMRGNHVNVGIVSLGAAVSCVVRCRPRRRHLRHRNPDHQPKLRIPGRQRRDVAGGSVGWSGDGIGFAEPYDAGSDRRVVHRRTGRHPAGAGHGGISVAGDSSGGGRRSDPRLWELPDP